MNPFQLTGRLALVTGASKGIGLGIAGAMAEAGADVILVARDPGELESAAVKLRETGRRISIAPFDLRKTDDITAWFSSVVEAHGRPDILVNAAGITRRAPTEDLKTEDWNDTLAVNLTAPFLLAQAFGRAVIAAGGRGKIINIGSMYSIFGSSLIPSYSAAKGGVIQLTKSMAIELAAYNIQVNAILPGWISTDMTSAVEPTAMGDEIVARTPAGRWGQPEECAGAAVFLASRAADFITGESLRVDGGYAIR